MNRESVVNKDFAIQTSCCVEIALSNEQKRIRTLMGDKMFFERGEVNIKKKKKIQFWNEKIPNNRHKL